MNELPYLEVYARYEQACRIEGQRLLWAARIASLPKMSDAGRREMNHDLMRMTTFSFEKRKDIFFADYLTDDDRLRMLGLSLVNHGHAHLRRHPEIREWMDSRGFTPAQAVAQYQSWSKRISEKINWYPINEQNSDIRNRLDELRSQRSSR